MTDILGATGPREVFGLSSACELDQRQLRQRYRHLALLVHPDKVPSCRRHGAETSFKILSQAFDDLLDSCRLGPYRGNGKKRRHEKSVQLASQRRKWCDLSFAELEKEIQRLEGDEEGVPSSAAMEGTSPSMHLMLKKQIWKSI